MLTFDTVRQLGGALPDVVDGTAYGAPALKLSGKLLACIATNKSADVSTTSQVRRPASNEIAGAGQRGLRARVGVAEVRSGSIRDKQGDIQSNEVCDSHRRYIL